MGSPCFDIVYQEREEPLEAERRANQQLAQSKQVGGSHYLKAIQPWDIIRAWGLGFHRGNILKYVLRAPLKNGKEDLEKAKHYLDYLITHYDDLKKENIL